MAEPPTRPLLWTVEDMERRWREAADAALTGPPVLFCTVDDGPRRIETWVRHEFVDAVRRAGVEGPLLWKALKNLRYGWDPARAMSRGGRDGVFLVSRDFRPRNAMVERLYAGFADTPDGGEVLASWFGRMAPDGPPRCDGVRVVSHGMRIVGFIGRKPRTFEDRPDAPKAKVKSKATPPGRWRDDWRLIPIDVDVNRR